MTNKKKSQMKLIEEYYAEVPVFKYAAMAGGIDEDTLLLWRKADSDFSDRLNLARVNWVKKNVPKAKIEFTLERLEREIFGPPKQEVKHSGIDGAAILLKEYGIIKDENDDRKDDGAVPSASKS